MHSRSCLTVAEERSHAFPDRSHLLRFVMRYAAAPRDRVGSSERSSGVRLQPSAGTGAFRPAFAISYPHYVKRELLDWSEMTRDNKKSPAMAWASLTRAAPLTTKSASRSPHSVQRNNRAHRERAFRQICPHCHGDARNTENKAKRANIGHIEAVSRRHNPGTVTSASPPHHQPR